MSLSNTATPKYYKEFRDSVLRGEIPVNKQVAMQMSLIDELISVLEQENDEYKQFTAAGTGSTPNVEGRLNWWKDKINGLA